MNFDDLKANNRVQIESENENPQLRNIKGIVVDINRESVLLVTDFGELVEISKDDILSITKVNFDKIVSDALVEMKNYITEIYLMETQLKKARELEYEYKAALFDANFLSKFNIVGAKNRLDRSISDDLLSFNKDILEFKVWFEATKSGKIDVCFRVSNIIDLFNAEKVDIEKVIKVHAPNEMAVIEKSFEAEKCVIEVEKNALHKTESIYSVDTTYRLSINISQDTFVEIRKKIITGLEKLKN